MEYFSEVLTILFVVFLGILSPGPNFFLVASRALAKSRKSGVAASIGVGLGSFLYSVAGFLGIAVIVKSSETALELLRLFGGSYLIYLGITMIISRNSHKADKVKGSETEESFIKSFATGLFTNLSNPKAMVIYISIFSMSADKLPFLFSLFTCILIFFISVLWYIFVAFSFSDSRVQSFYRKRNNLISGLFGSVIMAFGLKIIFNGK